MKKLIDRIHIRRFEAQDAKCCFKIRSAAFIQKFYCELGARATSAGVNAFMPDDYVEQWVTANWPDVTTLVVETVIPEYNSGFYQKAGFLPAGKAVCHFPAREVPALRLEKKIGPDPARHF